MILRDVKMDWKRNYRVTKTILRDVKMDWKRNYRIAKRFYETLKWTVNVIIELRNDSTRR